MAKQKLTQRAGMAKVLAKMIKGWEHYDSPEAPMMLDFPLSFVREMQALIADPNAGTEKPSPQVRMML